MKVRPSEDHRFLKKICDAREKCRHFGLLGVCWENGKTMAKAKKTVERKSEKSWDS